MTRSYFRPDRVFVSADLDCKRLNIEEWANNKKNPFEAGYDGSELCNGLKRYAYLNPINHRNSNTNNLHSEEIEIRPSVANDFVVVFWIKKPVPITDLSENIEFPNSCFQLLFEKALNYISYKQGDQTNIYTVSDRDINQLLELL